MSIDEYLEKKRVLQDETLAFINSTDNSEENFHKLMKIFEDQKINLELNELKSLLYLLSKISKNHNREPNFFDKITKILLHFKKEIVEYFSNWTIYNIFKSNKVILLFLIEEKMIILNKDIVNQMINKYKKAHYIDYFLPEIRSFLDDKLISEITENDAKDFNEKRKIGQNDNIICEFIQKDDIDKFITYVNKNNIDISMKIEESIFETNSFLVRNKNISLIKYAAFFGSTQIFKYLLIQKAKLSPSLWIYIIHGNNPEMIHLFEEQKVKPKDESFKSVFEEAIKCHHNEIANYILENYIEEKNINPSIFIKNYNFSFIQKESINNSIFFDLCKYDYFQFVDFLLKEQNVDVNEVFSDKIDSTIYFTVTDQDPPFDVEVDQEEEIEKTALCVSVERGNVEIVSLLSSVAELDINHEIETIRREMPPNDSFEPNEFKSRKTALSIAVENRNTKIVEIMLNNKNINVNMICNQSVDHGWGPEENPEYEIKMEKTPLLMAIENEDEEIIQLLLKCDKTDVNMQCHFSKTNYKWAPRKFGDIIAFGSYVNGYIKAHKKYQKEVKTALHVAVEKGNVKLVEMLLKNQKLDVNAIYTKTNEHDWQENETEGKDMSIEQTALCIAVENECIQIVQLLLENENIDANIPYKKTINSFKWINNEEADDLFSSCWVVNSHVKSDLKSTNQQKSVLHIAVEKENIDLIKILLKNKNKNINAVNDDGKMPIDCTNKEEIKQLLRH